MAWFDSTQKKTVPKICRIGRLRLFQDSMGGSVWSFYVCVVICLVDSIDKQVFHLCHPLSETFSD